MQIKGCKRYFSQNGLNFHNRIQAKVATHCLAAGNAIARLRL
jgi:hypothetical protein